jgi:hypothetical protein
MWVILVGQTLKGILLVARNHWHEFCIWAASFCRRYEATPPKADEQNLNNAFDEPDERKKRLVLYDSEVDATFGAHTRHVSNLTIDLDDYDQEIAAFEDLEIDKNSNRGRSRTLRGSQARLPPTKSMRQASIEQVTLLATRAHRHRSSSSFSIVSEMASVYSIVH